MRTTTPTCHAWPVIICSVFMTSLIPLDAGSQQNIPTVTRPSPPPDTDYFPPSDSYSPVIFSLAWAGEPSLYVASKDPTLVSYRIGWLHYMGGQSGVVRLVIKPDGSGQLICSLVSIKKTEEVKRTQSSVSVAEVEKFLQLVEAARFWSMPTKQPQPGKDSGGHTNYVLDGTPWLAEGVRGGSYHAVWRNSPAPGYYTEILRCLAKDMAKIDDAVIKIPRYNPPIK